MKDDNAAIALVCERLAETLTQLAIELRGEVAAEPGKGHAHMGLPWAERTLRQSLIVADLVSEGGSVSKDEWYAIAARYGYTGRGLAGFFRSDGSGLLELRGDRVYVTKSGKARLKENKDRVEAWRTTNA